MSVTNTADQSVIQWVHGT